jgi:hypothetical protein
MAQGFHLVVLGEQSDPDRTRQALISDRLPIEIFPPHEPHPGAVVVGKGLPPKRLALVYSSLVIVVRAPSSMRIASMRDMISDARRGDQSEMLRRSMSEDGRMAPLGVIGTDVGRCMSMYRR